MKTENWKQSEHWVAFAIKKENRKCFLKLNKPYVASTFDIEGLLSLWHWHWLHSTTVLHHFLKSLPVSTV